MNINLETLLEYFLEGNPITLAFIAAVLLFFHARGLVEFFEYLGARNLKYFTLALESKQASDIVNMAMREQLNRILYKKATGILAGVKLRGKLQEVITASAGGIEIDSLAQVKRFLKIENDQLTISVSWAHKFEYWLLTVGAVIVVLTGLLYGTIAVLDAGESIKMKALGIVFFLIYYVMGLFIQRKLCPPLKAAEKMKLALDTLYAATKTRHK